MSRRITPFIKQCFAVLSVAMNSMSNGLIVGFNVSLFSELRKTQEIPLSREAESWLASLIGITTLVGALFTSIIIDNIGRKPAILISSVLAICGWASFIWASSLTVLLIAKILQGLSVGLGCAMGGILVAEYSSPKYRGPFIVTNVTAMLFGIFISHSLGLVCNWHQISIILLFVSIPGLILAIFSPESPSFLAIRGRYDECRRIFRWLRGEKEDEELEKMIKTDMVVKEAESRQKRNIKIVIGKKLTYAITSFKKRELRMAIFIVIHLFAINQFSGAIINDSYAVDIHTALYSTDAYMFKVVTSLDVLKTLSTLLAIYLNAKIRRRLLLFIMVGLNIIAYISEAGYIYARRRSLLPFDHMAIGLFLHHLHLFTNGAGSLTLTTIIANELYPIADRGLCGLICSAVYSTYMFISLKTASYLFSQIGVDGTFCGYALLQSYCLVVLYYVLPETKDKTLQDVEDKLRGYSLVDRSEAAKLNENDEIISIK